MKNNIKVGYLISSIINYKINNTLSMQVEPRYIQKNHISKATLDEDKIESNIYSDYIEIPINIVYEFDLTNISPFLLGGISLGYLLDIDNKSKFNGEQSEYDMKDQFKGHNVALEIGAGVKHNLSNRFTLLFDVRYSHGIKNIYEHDNNIKSKGIQIAIGASYNL